MAIFLGKQKVAGNKLSSGVNCAQMFTSKITSFADGTTQEVADWGTTGNVNIGDFVCQPEKNRILIPKGSAEYIRCFGTIAGRGYISSRLRLKFEDGNWVDNVFNHQPQGNRYFAMSSFDRIYKLDQTQDYYLYLYISGYNGDSFNMNDGYGSSATFIGVEKIK